PAARGSAGHHVGPDHLRVGALEADRDAEDETLRIRVVDPQRECEVLRALPRSQARWLGAGQQRDERVLALAEPRPQRRRALARLVDHERRSVAAREAVVRARSRFRATEEASAAAAHREQPHARTHCAYDTAVCSCSRLPPAQPWHLSPARPARWSAPRKTFCSTSCAASCPRTSATRSRRTSTGAPCAA